MVDTQPEAPPSRPSTPSMTQLRNSPPPSPPSPEDSKLLSRKRQRQVSLEPASTPQASEGSEVTPQDGLRPARKNRRKLDPTAEEGDEAYANRSRSNSADSNESEKSSARPSPPHEHKVKMRQISQRVEGLQWKNGQNGTATLDNNVEGTTNDAVVADTHQATDSAIVTDNIETVPSVTVDDAALPASRDSESDGNEEKEKGVKRKLFERGASQGLPEETAKRPRDDASEDVNPRVKKRPTPPPESKPEENLPPRKRAKSPSPTRASQPKVGGFMAYASAQTPFASVKGQNVFSSSSKSPSPGPVASTSNSTTTSTMTTPAKQTGFEAFASSSSPFASFAASKSPVLGSSSKLGRAKSPSRKPNSSASINAFSAYASGGAQGFALPTQKPVRAASPDNASGSLALAGSALETTTEKKAEPRATTFGEKLRAQADNESDEDDKPKLNLKEQEVSTGEEDEETIHQVRGKLYVLMDGTAWKERGTGLMKLNVRASDGGGARLVMRKEAVYSVLLNVPLFRGMKCELAQDPRYLRFSVIENGVTTHYNLRLANAKIATELMEEILGNLPA